MATTAYFGEGIESFGIVASDFSGVDGSSFQYQFRAVALDTTNAGNVILPSGAVTTHSTLFGIMTNAPKSGESAAVRVFGETKVILGAAVSGAGVLLTATTNGFIIPAASDDVIIGISRFGSGSEGDIITAFVNFMAWGVF